MIVEYDTVYPVLDVKAGERGDCSFDFQTGEVNVYTSNKEVEPTGKSEMVVDTKNPYTPDVHGRNKRIRWILFEIASGSPVINEFGLIKKV